MGFKFLDSSSHSYTQVLHGKLFLKINLKDLKQTIYINYLCYIDLKGFRLYFP